MVDWKKHFPHKEPRPEQATALDAAAGWLAGPEKFMAAELPTGVGKSAVAVSLGRALAASGKKTYVLTSQKVLQDQYAGDFDMPDIRSSSEFHCSKVGTTCSEAGKFRAATNSPPCQSCPYRSAKERFVGSHMGVTNYSYFLSETAFVGQLTKRDLLILDEAHNVEKEVRSWATVSLSEEWCSRELRTQVPRLRDNQLFAWVTTGEYADKLRFAKVRLNKELSAAVRSERKSAGALARKLSFVEQHLGAVERLAPLGHEDVSMSWEGKNLVLRPFDVSGMVEEALYSKADKVLLMSATLLDKDEFFRSAAVPQSSVYLSLPTPFRREAYGVMYYPLARVTQKGLDDAGRANLVKGVRAVLRDNPASKGIIHTGNYELLKMLQQHLGENDRMLWQNTATDRRRILEEHVSTDRPTMLVSPGMTEGIDLRDELSRVQVILKVPWPSLGDPIVDRMSKTRPRWYAWSTAKTLVQAAGRSVRSMDDWAKTYVFDTSYEGFVRQWGSLLPGWMKPGSGTDDVRADREVTADGNVGLNGG